MNPVLSNTPKIMGTMGPVVPLGPYVPKGVRRLPRGDRTDLRHKGTQPGRPCVCEQVRLNSRLWNRSASIGQHGGPTQCEVCRPLPRAHWEVSHGLWSHMQLLAASRLVAWVPQSWEADTLQWEWDDSSIVGLSFLIFEMGGESHFQVVGKWDEPVSSDQAEVLRAGPLFPRAHGNVLRLLSEQVDGSVTLTLWPQAHP